MRELCVISHCIFLNITNARIPHERGARLRQIGPVGLKQAPSTGLDYGLDDLGIVLESGDRRDFLFRREFRPALEPTQPNVFSVYQRPFPQR